MANWLLQCVAYECQWLKISAIDLYSVNSSYIDYNCTKMLITIYFNVLAILGPHSMVLFADSQQEVMELLRTSAPPPMHHVTQLQDDNNASLEETIQQVSLDAGYRLYHIYSCRYNILFLGMSSITPCYNGYH